MSENFRLLRLPSLALDHVVKVMDPMDQFCLCQASLRFKKMVRKLTVKQTFYITPDEMISAKFGHGEKTSIIEVDTHTYAEGSAMYGKIYANRNGSGVLYHNQLRNALDEMFDLLAEVFEPRVVVCSFEKAPLGLSMMGMSSPSYNFSLLENQGEACLLTKSRCSKSSASIWETQKTSNNERQIVLNKKANWMTLDETMFLFTYIALNDLEVTNDELNQFLKKWKIFEDMKSRYWELIAIEKSEEEFNIYAIVEGLDGKSDEEKVEYQIERADGNDIWVYVKDNKFYLNSYKSL